jgi:hypothetical protein
MLGLHSTYTLDHLDLTVETTFDQTSERSVSDFLDSLSQTDATKAAGLDQDQLLNAGNPRSVIYSVTLYERGKNANPLRIQTDNYDQPLNINRGTKLQLGSTAKLRTLINYLQIVGSCIVVMPRCPRKNSGRSRSTSNAASSARMLQVRFVASTTSAVWRPSGADVMRRFPCCARR